MLETETIYPGGNLPKQKYLKRMWRGLAVLLLSILIILVIRSCGTTEPVPSQPAFGCEYAEEQAVEPVPETLFDELGMETAEPHDIDMEVKCTPEQEQNIFKLLSDSQKQSMYQMKEKEDYLSNAERRMDKVTWTHKPYLFQWGDVIINVWVVSEFSHEYVTLDSGIKFAKVMSVIRKKIAYQRNKDRAFLINLAYRFLGMVGANGKNLSAVFNPDYR